MTASIVKPRVFIVCSGLGTTKRGYESFFRDVFDELVTEDALDVRLFKGSGTRSPREKSLWTLPRESRSARLLGWACGRSGYFIEQLTFFISFFPRVVFRRPHVVYVSDIVLANLLRLTKRLWGSHATVCYVNGGNVPPHFLHRWDVIQHVCDWQAENAVKAGLAAPRQRVLPHGVRIARDFTPPTDEDKALMRKQLGLPPESLIVLSVGAISRTSKRMDYLIRELSQVRGVKPFLVMLGQERSDTESILREADHLLGPHGYCARTVARADVDAYYRAADVFALASMVEGFGLVYVEALSHGLPCLVHDYPTTRYIFRDMANYVDMSGSGALADAIATMDPAERCAHHAQLLHEYAYRRFSWDALRPQYVSLLRDCAALA